MAPQSLTLQLVMEATGGELIGQGAGGAATKFAGAATDSRAVQPGQLFFALPGERVDGFLFCGAAAKAGAAAVVVARGRGLPEGCAGLPVVAVDDARLALGALALAVRRRFRGRVIGVTGSNGKTTTKELVAAALSAFGSVLRTAGNLNTDVGLPLTVLQATGKEDFWVLEMAMRARGEIAALAAMAEPHVGVITNVAGAHLERLGSLEEIARAKGELFHGLLPDGIAVLPAGDALIDEQAAHLPRSRQLRFGAAPNADASILDLWPAGAAGSLVRYAVRDCPVVVRLPLAGAHNACNGAAALAVTAALGLPAVPAAAALESASLPEHRSRPLTVGGRTVLDDCYNANPASMTAALRTVAGMTPSGAGGFAVLGDMLELGPEAEALHEEVGRELRHLGLRGVAAIGPLGAAIARGAQKAGLEAGRAVACADPLAAAAAVASWSRPGDVILVKASRGMKLERAIAELERLLGDGDGMRIHQPPSELS